MRSSHRNLALLSGRNLPVVRATAAAEIREYAISRVARRFGQMLGGSVNERLLTVALENGRTSTLRSIWLAIADLDEEPGALHDVVPHAPG